MEALFLLIPLSVALVFLIGAAFWWSLRGGQYDDLEGPGYRLLMDDDNPPEDCRDEKKPAEDSGRLGQGRRPEKIAESEVRTDSRRRSRKASDRD